MKVCPRCYDNNPVSATECRQCGLALGALSATAPHLCPAGLHVMDPTWKVCVFCKADAPGAGAESFPAKGETEYEGPPRPRRTVVETDPRFSGGTIQEPEVTAAPPPSGAAAARRTRFDSGSPSPGAPAQAGVRRIVGVLITYTWQPDGQIFAVREGRNLIGRDPAQADIAIPQDDTLSAVNSHITFRKNFVIGDQISMGGTDVNGEPVEQQFHPLPNYSRIRTGSTMWTFIAISPAERAGEG